MSRISIMYSPVDFSGEAVSYTKTFLEDGTKKSYGNAYKAYVKDIEVNTIDDLSEVIDLCNDVDGCLTGGQPRKDYSFRIRRLIYDDEKNHYKATIKKNTKFSVLVVDIDDKPNPYPYTDFENHLGYILTQLELVLPEALECDFIFQFSSSAGLRDSSNCHLFFLLDDEYTYDEISNIFENFNSKAKELDADIRLDNSVNTRTQPIYVTNPIFEKSSQNPIKKRVFKVVSDKRQLSLPEWILEMKEKVEDDKEIVVFDDELLDEIKDYHLESAKKAFNGAADSATGLGRFVKTLKLKKYSKDVVEAAWENFYDGTNFTLVRPTAANKHKYKQFADTWNSIPYTAPDYFVIDETLTVSTDTRDNCIIVPDWSRNSLINLSKSLLKYKEKKQLNRVPKLSIKLDKKVSDEIREHIIKFAKDNMLRWRII